MPSPELEQVIALLRARPLPTDVSIEQLRRIFEASMGMLLETTAWEMGSAVHPHPTLAEAVGEAALAVDGKSINF